MQNINELESDFEKCENCGSNMIYSINHNGLHCSFCNSVKIVSDVPSSFRHSLNNFVHDEKKEEQKQVNLFKCENCGADIKLNNLQISNKCPYCDSANVMDINEYQGLRPDSIIKFAIPSESVGHYFKSSLKYKFFVPRAFKKQPAQSCITALYFPSFTFDATTFTTYNGTLYRYEKSGDETKKVNFYVKSNIQVQFDDVIVESSSHISQSMLNNILPYNMTSKIQYKSEYLLGYIVEKHNDLFKNAVVSSNQIMENQIVNYIVSRHNAVGVEHLNKVVNYSNRYYNYTILPAYVIEYRYGKKSYKNYMNGQTGKVAGKLPVSPWKVSLVVFAVIAFIACIIYAVLTNS